MSMLTKPRLISFVYYTSDAIQEIHELSPDPVLPPTDSKLVERYLKNKTSIPLCVTLSWQLVAHSTCLVGGDRIHHFWTWQRPMSNAEYEEVCNEWENVEKDTDVNNG